MHVIVEEARESYRWRPAPVPGIDACTALADILVCSDKAGVVWTAQRAGSGQMSVQIPCVYRYFL